MENELLYKQFSLLKRIVGQFDEINTKADLSAIEKMIFTELPEALEGNAPQNFPELYFDFKYEYERFKSFIIYEKLIGKNIVALGGGFSSGKSSFLNSLMEQKMLPAQINPSTSVPTYLVRDNDVSVYGINTFQSRVELELEDVKSISHGFGKLNDDDEAVTLGHVLDSIFISSPSQPFQHIALLDTPGYSKAESKEYSAKTDETIARVQLNSSNYILWFVQAENGTITNEDIAFLNSLNKDIPKLIIVNKADKVTPDNLASIVVEIRDKLDLKGIAYVDVLTYTRKKDYPCDKDKIVAQLKEWDTARYENRFAYNFKVLFTKCKEYYDDELDNEGRRLNRLNKAVTLSSDGDVSEYLTSLMNEVKRNITNLKERKEALQNLQNEFFAEIKRIGDIVHIDMPEPSDIDLIRDKIVDPKTVLEEYCQKKGIKVNTEYVNILTDVLADIKPVMQKQEGGSEYNAELVQIMTEALNIPKQQIKFPYQLSKENAVKELGNIFNQLSKR